MSSPGSRPVAVPSQADRGQNLDLEHRERSNSRVASNARLASPIPSADPKTLTAASPTGRGQVRSRASGTFSPLAGFTQANASGPGASALAHALNRASASGSQPAVAEHSGGPAAGAPEQGRTPASRASHDQARDEPYEDFDVVRRHLAGPGIASPSLRDAGVLGTSGPRPKGSQRQLRHQASRDPSIAPGIDEDEFSSLRMQGGDVTREIYRRAEAEASIRVRPHRTQSMYVANTATANGETDAASINQPGGFRREHIRRHAHSPKPSVVGHGTFQGSSSTPRHEPQFVARNFFEFLSLYGHFAGEDVDDDDDDDDDSWDGGAAPRSRSRAGSGYESDDEVAQEGTALLKSARRRRRKELQGSKAGTTATILMLLKSFVGTGVLFLPRAFLNGGMVFGIVVMVAVASISYYCFLLLTTSRLKLKGSFAEMGEMVQGRLLRSLINSSLVISQIGFASAYIVFTSENLRAFILAVSKCRTHIDIKFMILMQLIVFLPLSLYRNLNNISFVVYVADLFIVLGIVYLYYFDISTLVSLGGLADVRAFNGRGWTLFIGTAIFTFEGIGLIIPIQDGMKKPSQLPSILGLVMVIITVIFVSMGALAYGAFGSKTETVVLLNMPQDNKFVNGVQFIYSLAILLSTPMQIFPAITIMEKGIFKKSGKYNRWIKWRKNGFRFCVVMVCAMIAWVGANDLDKFVALVGSFACIPLVYLYPPFIHYRAVAEKRWQRAVDVLLIVLGSVLMLYTSLVTVVSWVGGGDEPKSPGYCDRR